MKKATRPFTMVFFFSLPYKEYGAILHVKTHHRRYANTQLHSPRAKIMVIKEAKDLYTLPLDELIRNLKVYEMVLDNDDVTSKTTKEKVKSLALEAKVTREQTSDDGDSQRGIDEDIDEEEAEDSILLG
ncbi:hypothetical protein Tco_0169727 [Tanacetum coccineum]